MTIIRMTLAAVMLVWSSLVTAQVDNRPEATNVGGWFIIPGKSSCTMTTTYEDGARVIVDFNQRLKRAQLAFSDPSVKSLTTGDKRSLKIAFKRGRELDTGWGEKNFEVVDLPSDRIRYFVATLEEQILDDIAVNEIMGFFYGDILLKSFKLTNSALAIASLKTCAARMARLNPSDPFANEAKD